VDEKDEETGDTMRHAKRISFHDAERRLQYPYKGL